MLSKQQKSELRSRLFRHLDGLVVAPSAYALMEKGITEYLLENGTADVDELAERYDANPGYLNVALRILCSQGWLIQELNNEQNTVVYKTNEQSSVAFDHFNLYQKAVGLLKLSEKYSPRKFEMEPFLELERLFHLHQQHYGMSISEDEMTRNIRHQIAMHIEGIIVGPTLVRLGMNGMFHKYFMETRFKAEEFHKDADGFERLLDILAALGWYTKINGAFEFTDKGLFFARRASAYGVTVSYIPTLRKLDELIFGDPNVLRGHDSNADEVHVDREMNVWGSGGAHAAYFKVIDEIIIEMFNRPINDQPRGILDMGCGNGAFLQHLYTIIETQTWRGEHLDEYPLALIGVDYNEAALKASKAKLIQAEIWAKIIWGDIGDPEGLARDLDEKYGIDLKDLLNVRTFLDHNRIWESPVGAGKLRTSASTGAFASRGERLSNNLVSESLKQHLKKWVPYIKKHGLLLIELHTVNPQLVSLNMGKTAATAYDGTHGYSDQYILEIEEFLSVIKELGLESEQDSFRRFPNSDLATVSINLLKAPQA